MAYVDGKLLEKVWKAIVNKNSQQIIKELGEHTTLTFSEIREKLLDTKKTPLIVYYMKNLQNSKLIRRDGKYYFLTPMGLEAHKLIEGFEKVCTQFSLNDLDTDGKLKVTVVYNHLIK